jgi:cell division initiation protein
MEESLQNTLLLAQRTADDVKASAHHKAELIIDEARAAANREAALLEARTNDARREYQQALQLAEKAKNDLRGMLSMYMQMLDKTSMFQAPAALGAAQSVVESVSPAPTETTKEFC